MGRNEAGMPPSLPHVSIRALRHADKQTHKHIGTQTHGHGTMLSPGQPRRPWPSCSQPRSTHTPCTAAATLSHFHTCPAHSVTSFSVGCALRALRAQSTLSLKPLRAGVAQGCSVQGQSWAPHLNPVRPQCMAGLCQQVLLRAPNKRELAASWPSFGYKMNSPSFFLLSFFLYRTCILPAFPAL